MSSADKMLGREAFSQAFLVLHTSLEQRRKRYLRLFYINSVLAASLLFAGLVYPQTLLTWIARQIHRNTPVTNYEVASLVFFACVSAVMLIFTPVLRYRGGFKTEFGLHRVVLARICELLGDCSISSPALSFLHNVRASSLFPADAGISELPGIRGTIGKVNFSIQEVAVASALNGKEACVFRGVLVVASPQKGRSGLNLEHTHRALMLHRDCLTDEYIKASGLEKAEYVTSDIMDAQNLACIATHRAFAEPVIAESQLAELFAIAAHINLIKPPERKIDRVIIEALQRQFQKIRESLAAKSEKPAIAAELEYDALFCSPVDIITAVPSEEYLPACSVGISVNGQSRMIALPSSTLIFTTLSLFQPSFSIERALLLYDIVHWVSGMNTAKSTA